MIDWHDASRGNPAADVARTWLLLRTAHWQYRGVQRLAIGLTAWWVFRRYLEAYEELVPGTREELYRWRLPVAAARLSEGVAGVEGPLAELAERLARLAG
ncbi:MAG TPA: hypothetical protein DCM14_07950 [Clostridiales bacterium UBA8153]|nr:hypothetical protein [Clostridiales bacterium UBA8153]